MEPSEHEPVLRKEVIEYLNPRPGMTIVDGTLGGGGHALDILKQLGGDGLVVGLDIDPHAIERARRRIEAARIDPAHFKPVVGNFADLNHLLQHVHAPPPGGILLDLGPSSPQLLDPELGLSWESEQALDMRLSRRTDQLSAAEIVNTWSEKELARLFRRRAQERFSGAIARRIVRARPIRTGRQLGEVVAAAIPRRAWPPKIHPATRVFLALRMEVNRELENLEAALPQALEALAPGGRLVVLSFHSGEDRLVKTFFRAMARSGDEVPWPLPQGAAAGAARLRILTARPVRPGPEEVRRNPRSRSARLRAAEKIG